MKKLLLILTTIIAFTFAGCTDNTEDNPEFIFTAEVEELIFSSEVVADNVPESFKAYWDTYFIEDFKMGDDYYYITYVDMVNEQEVWMIAGFDSSFELMWETEITTEYYLTLIDVNEEYVIVHPRGEDVQMNIYNVYSHSGTLLHSIETESWLKWHQEAYYYLESINQSFKVNRLQDGVIETVYESDGNNPSLRYFEDGNIMIMEFVDEHVSVTIIDQEGYVHFEKLYENGEDIYNLYNGFMVDDGEHNKIEVYDCNGGFFWEVDKLKDSISGLKIVDGNMVLVEGDNLITISPKGKLISREEREVVLEIPVENNLTFNDHELEKGYGLEDQWSIYQVIKEHEVQVSGLRAIYMVIDGETVLTLGGEDTQVKFEYYDEDYIYFIETGMMLDYTPGHEYLYVVDYDGNIVHKYTSVGHTFEGYDRYEYYFDQDTIVKVYLPYVKDNMS